MLFQHADHKANAEYRALYDQIARLEEKIDRIDRKQYPAGIPLDYDFESGYYVGTGAGLTEHLEKKFDVHGVLITRTDATAAAQVLWTKEMGAINGRNLATGAVLAVVTGGVGSFTVIASALTDVLNITFSYLAWGRYNNEAARP